MRPNGKPGLDSHATSGSDGLAVYVHDAILANADAQEAVSR
ncbi:MAG TPA: hypothetical protein VGH45_05880 [Solirubrobacteraceae bacterium]|jgi:hypothetical protein